MRKTTSIAVIGLFGFLVCLATAAEKTKAAKNNLKPADIFRGTNILTALDLYPGTVESDGTETRTASRSASRRDRFFIAGTRRWP